LGCIVLSFFDLGFSHIPVGILLTSLPANIVLIYSQMLEIGIALRGLQQLSDTDSFNTY